MAETSISTTTTQTGHYFAPTTAYNSYVHQGDVYNVQGPAAARQEPDEIVHYGLCLKFAPIIDPSYFVGRAEEMDTIKKILHPGHTSIEQRRLVLGGIGGIGKTQLALAYAQQHHASYTSVFWLNAMSKVTLNTSFRLLAEGVLDRQKVEQLEDGQALAQALVWLADTRNSQWLLIFDNYDEPDQFDIEEFYPYAGHGSVIITTRRPDLVMGQLVHIQPLTSLEDGLNILQTRSGRKNVHQDPEARCLAERMCGLPLALATAGAYLRQSVYTFQQYLKAYEHRWEVDRQRAVRLREYRDRTLYTTWNLSCSRLEAEDPDAAVLLRLLAYFNNQEMWYELFRAGLSEHSPTRLQTWLSDQDSFEGVMRSLSDYGFVEVQYATQSYSIHACVHDWMLGELNRRLDPQLYWHAFDAVAASVYELGTDTLEQIQYARVSRHALRLTHPRFWTSTDLEDGFLARLEKAAWIADLLTEQRQFIAAEQMYSRTLAGMEKVLGPNHTSTLSTVRNFGILYHKQSKLEKAEQMYLRALAGIENAQRPDNIATFATMTSLGSLYREQGKLDEAEQMYLRAITGYEKVVGLHHASTLIAVINLGNLYHVQGKLDQAEQMYRRALAGREKALGLHHTLTLDTFYSLGSLYRNQGKLDEAEQMFLQTLAGREKALGSNHISTLDARHCLANLYKDQHKPDQAEFMYQQLLKGYEAVAGIDHLSTLLLVRNFGLLYLEQGRLGDAECMYQRALVGYRKRLGQEHPRTLWVSNALSKLYRL